MDRVTVLDGGMGKELRRIGAPFRQPEWSALALMEAPDLVLQAHRNFIEAGAEVITTNNYAVVPYHLGEDRVAGRGRELIALAGRLARGAADAADHPVTVAGSLPPVFGSYRPENFDPVRAAPYYLEMVDALDPYVDLWIGETLSRVDEMSTILDAIAAAGSGQPAWMAFCLPDEYDPDAGVTLRTGETPADIADAALARVGAVEAILFNCSLPEQTGPAIRELADALAERNLDIRTGGYANAFPTTARSGAYDANSVIIERRDDLTPQRYADMVAGWIEDGASIIGGCCDMYPEHIAALVDRFRS